MALGSPLLPPYKSSAQVPRLQQTLGQLKLLGGGGATKRFLLLLLTAILSTLVVCSFLIQQSQSSIQRYCSSSLSAKPPIRGPDQTPPTHLHPLPLSATLEERLKAFRNAPGVGWEPADFVNWNLETCSNVVENHNNDLLAKSSLVWSVLNSSAVIQHRERMARFLEEKQKEGAFDSVHISEGGRGFVGKGRGIVFTAGNADTLSRVVITLKLIRQHFKSNLPAAIFHFPSERPDPNSPLVSELRDLNAKLVEATGRDRDPTREKNYQLKAQSIVESEWAEVIYFDSDNLPAANPELLFDAPNYKRLGVFFAPDYWKTSASNPIWHIIGVQCRDEWEQEAGQIVIDKRRHLDAMLLSLYMLTDWQYWFYFSDGDKDVFRFAMLALRKRWALPGRYVGGGGLPRGTMSGDFCAHTMQQYDHAGRPMFIHYNLLKQIPSGVFLGFTWGRTKQLSAFPSLSHNSVQWNASVTSGSDVARVPYPDDVVRGADDVEADMLANADDDGWTIYPGSDEVRRRAALERGIRPFFHGGGNTAFCIDMKWVDPAPASAPRPKKSAKIGDKEILVSEANQLGIDWGKSPLEIALWADDDRLREFELVVYNLGFQPSGRGF
ncbi:glycosyltransferase family 71 protein [Ramaria rubella]|nr:glycosyltransferase family 71 protein [Ramaria rubella]